MTATDGGTRRGTITGQSADALSDAVGGFKPSYLREVDRLEGTEITNPAG